jgi:hypothetical protein
MESNKHNDELIKRKLADLNAEPRKLNFATVHANYEKARQTSSKKWGIYFIIGGLAFAVLVTTYVLLLPGADNTLAHTGSIGSNQTAGNPNTITSVGTSNEDKFTERSNSESNLNSAGNISTGEKQDNTISNNSSANDDVVTNSENTNTKEETVATSKKEISAKKNNAVVTSKKTKTNKTKIAATKKNETSIGSKIEKTRAFSDSKSSKKDVVTSDSKNNTNASMARSGNSNSSKKKEEGGADDNSQINKNLLANNSDPDQSSKTGGENTGSRNDDNANNKTDRTADQNPKQNNDQNIKAGNEQTNNNEQAKNLNESAKTDSISNKNDLAVKIDTAHVDGNLPVVGNGTVSPRNKHKFLLGGEVSYYNIAYNAKENPNAPSQFSTGDPAFSTAYANAVGNGKHSLFTGAISFGYVYNERFGISAGLSYFNVKNKFTVGSSSVPEYTAAIDYYVWSFVPTADSLIYKITDTVYKQVPTGKHHSAGTTVNGDSVSTGNFQNTIRYVNIPLNLSYNIKIGAKFSVEPQAGVIYAMPLKSKHLVATDVYKFEYSKQKTDLRKTLYFNTALKVGYNISNKMQLYVRGGYFFRNQSVYHANQPVYMSLKSIYTSFGISYRIK